MVESALAFTTFLFMVFGVMEFGRAVWMYNSLTYLAHEGARYACVRGNSSGQAATTSDVSAYVKSVAVGVAPSALLVTTTYLPNNNPGSAVKVTVQYAFSFVAPFIGTGIPMRGTSQMTITQ